MKKAMLLAVCLVLAGLLAVNGTFAGDFGRTVQKMLANVFRPVEDLTNPAPTDAPKLASLAVEDEKAEGGEKNKALFPGTSVTRTYTVSNTTSTTDNPQPIFFRLAVAVRYDDDSWEKTFGITFNKDSNGDSREIEIGGKQYKLYVFDGELAKDAPWNLTATVIMKKEMTDAQYEVYWQGDFLKAELYSIERKAFVDAGYKDAETALNAALGDFNPTFN